MDIITIATQKGGGGKSTLSTNLAVASTTKGKSVLIIDADPKQKTVSEWFNLRDEQDNPIVLPAYDIKSLQKILIAAEKNGVERVFIDTQGNASTLVEKAISIANIVLIPTGTSGFDLPAQRLTADSVRKLKKDATFIFMKAPPRGKQELEEAKQMLSALGVHINSNKTVYRTDYKNAAKYSSTVLELNPQGKAAEEIIAILKWLDKRLSGGAKQKLMQDIANG